jgi:predicted aldo/keto reductase-like oxidoreductase
MAESHQSPGVDPMRRREFLQSTAATTAAASVVAASARAGAQQDPAPAGNKPAVLPTRTLGRTGVKVTLLNEGTVKVPSAIDRILRRSYSEGVRYYDTAAGYNTEQYFKRWFEAMPEVRKSIFLATKQGISGDPMDMLKHVDERLEKLGTDYIDLLFFHGLEGNQVDWPKSKEMAAACDAVKKTGKVKFVGFTTHDATRAQQIQNAAEGNFVDVIMLQFSPWLEKGSDLDRALDACHARNIGLVSMKQIAGKNVDEVPKRVKDLEALKLTPHQALLQAIWTDERISSACVTMMNLEQVEQNASAARRFEPLKLSLIHELRDAVLAGGQTLCTDCDGRCAHAAGTKAHLADLTRFYTYYEGLGSKAMAHEGYAALSDEARNWRNADLEAARHACPGKLNFAQILPEVDRLLG